MIYLTGDTHRDFTRFGDFFRRNDTTKRDVMVILGDAGVNYFGDSSDKVLKGWISSSFPITLFCIHGNHEMRPSSIPSYRTRIWHGGSVWYEAAYPSILFAKDGEIYTFGGKRVVVIGGAYSVDKEYRLRNEKVTGLKAWWADEQPDAETKRRVESRLAELRWKVDYVFSHTCPLDREPRELFLSGLDQSTVDDRTERWFETIEERLTFSHWYFGHFHGQKEEGKFTMLYENIMPFKP